MHPIVTYIDLLLAVETKAYGEPESWNISYYLVLSVITLYVSCVQKSAFSVNNKNHRGQLWGLN